MVFQTALSGIKASAQELDVIGNNIANSATIGFKGSRAEFADLYTYGAYGSGNTAIGNGVKLSRVHQSFATGNMVTTGNSLDLAINGNGFFMMSDQGAKVYTRAGQFEPNKDNYIVNANGHRLQGLLADATGTLTGATGDLQINRANITPQPSTLVRAGVNLHSLAKAPTTNWIGGANPAPDSYNDTTTSVVYDSLGNQHVVSMYFIHADSSAVLGDPNASTPPGETNQWYVAFQIDGQNVPPNVGADNTSNLYRANFNADGTFKEALDTSNNPLPNNLIPLGLTLTNGAAPLNFEVDLTDSTQFGSKFGVLSIGSDGYATGSLSGLEVADDGSILGRYTNGETMLMGKVLLANFSNSESLQNLGNTSWAETSASGQPLVSSAGTGGLGMVNSGKLEESNVDLTSELVKLIGSQRNFQANAQTIRTGDAITQTIINIR